MNRIFVQIASYRDYELLPTIRDIISKSSGENELTFGVVWQKDEDETIGEFIDDSRFRIIDCDWRASRGLGWARSLAQSLYNDEEYTLQLDSHHRFEQNWDKILINMYNQVKDVSDKPLLTAYAAGYDPNNDKQLSGHPCRILPHDFKSSGTIWFNPNPIPDYQSLSRPIRGRLVSGHYFFTTGQHCIDYVYDPDMYFAGDEICLSVRSYTLGYDIYHPHINVVYHHYGRRDRVKHWNDHTIENKVQHKVEKTWMERDKYSKERIRQLLGEEDNGIDLGIFGLGDIRSLNDYEKYAGIDFKNKRIQKCAIDGVEPPVIFDTDASWEEGFKKTTPVNLVDWGRENLLLHQNILDKIIVEYISLQKKVIDTKILSKDFIANNVLLQNTITADHTPMKVVISAVSSNGKILQKIEKDLRPNIHWN